MDSNESHPAGIEEFVNDEWAGLLAALIVVCGRSVDAEGALAEATARAWERLDRREEIRSLRGWVLAVALNIVRTQGRRRGVARRAHRLLLAGATATTDPPSTDSLDLLDALRHLSYRQRQAVVLYYWADLPISDVAELMEVAEGTVKALLHQGREGLRRMLARTDDPDEVLSRKGR